MKKKKITETNPGSEAVDFMAMSIDLTGHEDKWFADRAKEKVELYALPLNSIENARLICEKAGKHSELWRKAKEKWLELSRSEVEAASDKPSIWRAFDGIPNVKEVKDWNLSSTAVVKAASYCGTFEDVRGLIAMASAKNVIDHEQYDDQVLQRMLALSKTLEHYAFICDKTEFDYKNNPASEAKSIFPAALEGLKGRFMVVIKGKSIRQALEVVEKVPYQLWGQFIDYILEPDPYTEKQLRAFLKSYHYKGDNDMSQRFRHRLDTKVENKIRKAKADRASLNKLRAQCRGLHMSSNVFQQRINEVLASETFDAAKRFEDFAEICSSTTDPALFGRCWAKMKNSVKTASQAREMLKLAGREDSVSRREALSIWLAKAGNDRASIEEIFKDTHSTSAYVKLLGYVETFTEALNVLKLADKEADNGSQYRAGFSKVLECITSIGDGLEFLSSYSDEYNYRDEKTRIVARTFTVAPDKESALRVARIVRLLRGATWEMHAAMVIRLSEFYRVPQK